MKEKIIKCKHCLGTGEIKIIPGKEVKKARLNKDLSLRGLGEILDFSASYLHDIESDRRAVPQKCVDWIMKNEILTRFAGKQ